MSLFATLRPVPLTDGGEASLDLLVGFGRHLVDLFGGGRPLLLVSHYLLLLSCPSTGSRG